MTVYPEEGHQAVGMKQASWLACGLKPGLPSLLIAHQPPPPCVVPVDALSLADPKFYESPGGVCLLPMTC